MAAAGSKITTAKVKPISIAESSSRPKLDPSVTKKKIESSTKLAVSKSVSTSTVTKSEVKSKTTPSSSKTTTKTSSKTTTRTVTKAREKKVYTLPGQKHDPPEEREPLRIFYESLSQQIPTSEMAEFWMMEHGLLSPERAKKAHEKKQRKQKQLRMGTPIKSPPPSTYSKPLASSSSSSLRKPNNPPPKNNNNNGDLKAKKRLVDSDDDDDFILSSKKRRV